MSLRGFVVAVVFAAFGLVLTVMSRELRFAAPYLLPMASVMVAAWYGGLWAGLLSLLALIIGLSYFALEPLYSMRVDDGGDMVRLSLFALVAICISLIIERTRRTAATLRATLASIDDAVIVTDRQGRITFMNPVAERLTGWTLKKALGYQVADVYRIVDEASREPVSNRIEGMLRAGVLREGMILGPPKEQLLISADGTEYPVVDSGSSVIDERGERTGAVLVFRDVTEQLATRKAAERANRLKDEFLATVSHELRTPLNAVLGWTKMLRAGTLAPGTVTRAIEAVDRNADALATLVNDLLDVSRIVAGQLRLKPAETDVTSLVRESLETLGPSMTAKRLRLDTHMRDVPHIVVDANRVRQVIWNLLSNAIKFTPAGGEVSVNVAQRDGVVQIVVADTGQGIDPSQLPFVFNRFWQADAAPTRTIGGLGLGLAIVRHLVEAHAGTVTVESEGLGKGARFMVTLPLIAPTRDVPTPVPEKRAAPREPAAARVLEGCIVLAVDDEVDSLELVAETLRSHGAAVLTARSADAAIDAFRTGKPHVVVADLAMPGKDGYDFLRALRGEPGGQDVPAVALTAYAGENHRRAALDAGFTEHVEKPVNPAHLAAVVSDVARRQPL